MASRQRRLDPILALEPPIHRVVQIILVRPCHPELLRQRRGVPPARSGERGAGMRAGTEPSGEVELVQGYRNDGHRALRERPDGLEQFANWPLWLATQFGANGVDLFVAQRGEVGQRAGTHARAVAVELAQQARWA